MTKQSAEAMVEDVAHDVEEDEELPVSPGSPAVTAAAAASDNAPTSTSQRILSGAAAAQRQKLKDRRLVNGALRTGISVSFKLHSGSSGLMAASSGVLGKIIVLISPKQLSHANPQPSKLL